MSSPDERMLRLPLPSLTEMKVLYAAFDVYPGHKGAQAHIRTNLQALAECGGQATLLCLGQKESFRDPDSGAMVHAYPVHERNMLRRSELFGRFLIHRADLLIADPPAIIHFRDIWSGIPLLSHPIARRSRMVFEVNGFPSVELPNHYPRMAGNNSLLARIRRMENDCLSRADRVITVSRRTSCYLAERGCDAAKIVIIPNAADPPASPGAITSRIAGFEEEASDGRNIILYAGTLAPWQGLHVLLEAITLLAHRRDFRLVVAASTRKGIKRFRKRIVAKGLDRWVTVLDGLHHRVMPLIYERAYVSVAPLTRSLRNELQGCCPLKIVESMANRTPVVASDLPVARELVAPGVDGMLVAPGVPRALAGALELLLDNRTLRDRLALGAFERARRDFGTRRFAERLTSVYTEVIGGIKA